MREYLSERELYYFETYYKPKDTGTQLLLNLGLLIAGTLYIGFLLYHCYDIFHMIYWRKENQQKRHAEEKKQRAIEIERQKLRRMELEN